MNRDWRELLSSLTEPEREQLDQLISTDGPPSLADFVRATVSFDLHPWQRDHLCPVMETLVRDKGRRFLIHAPPQYGKSIIVSKRFPAWALGVNPLLRIVVAGYNETHAAAFTEVVREIMRSPEYLRMFPSPRCRV